MSRMTSTDARSMFERLLAARHLDLAMLSVEDGVAAMLAFYRTTRADDCDLDADGDMLLFQWGPTTVDGAPARVLDITRQFIRDGGEDEGIWQLSLQFVVAPRPDAAGDRWCDTPAQLDAFTAFVTTSAAYQAATLAPPQRTTLRFECAG